MTTNCTEELSEQAIEGILKDARLPVDKETVFKAVDYIDSVNLPDDFLGIENLIEEDNNDEV